MEQPSASDPFPARFVSMRNLHAGECQLMKKYSASSIFDFIDFNIIIRDVFRRRYERAVEPEATK